MKRIFRPWHWAGLTALFLLGLLMAVLLRGPYLWPTTVALGPCLPDYSSPSTWRGERASPLLSTAFNVGDVRGLVCYGSPSARGRQVFEAAPSETADTWAATATTDTTTTSDAGAPSILVRNGALWRLGANEPTRLFIDGPILLGGLPLDAGRYSLYARPDSAEWTIFVSASTNHWGNTITPPVRAREVGSFHVPILPSGTFVESFSVTYSEPPGDTPALVFEWADRQILIPVEGL